MNPIDRWFTHATRRIARRSSRRGFLAQLAALLVGGAVFPLLPVARAAQRATLPGEPDGASAAGDPGHCDYWRHCAIDGFLCGCCGGSHRSCPPGTQQSGVTWIGTCLNPADGKNYIISYNDCCGKHVCGLCYCHRNEGDKPIYFPQRSNDINWCDSSQSVVYNCSTAIVLGMITDS